MLCVMDIGNTNVYMGIYRGKELVVWWLLSTDRKKTADEYAMLLKNLFDYEGLSFKAIDAVVFSSVVPPLVDVFSQMCQKYFLLKPLVVREGVKTGLRIKTEHALEVGADKIVNAMAAYEKYGGPVIVVDFGTANTVCAISAEGEYLGGAIAPGIGISTEALFQRAAKLPRIELIKPEKVIGKNTIHSMQAGIIYGFIGQINGIVERFQQELGGNAAVVATGKMVELLSGEKKINYQIDPLLTLEGLRLIYERNKEFFTQ